MILLYLTLFAFAFLVIVLTATQVVLPIVGGTPVFPMFRKSPEKEALEDIETELEKANELAGIQSRLDALADKVSSKLKNGKVK